MPFPEPNKPITLITPILEHSKNENVLDNPISSYDVGHVLPGADINIGDWRDNILTSVPDNLSPKGAGRARAFNEAKRKSGIPVSQSPANVYQNIDKRGNKQPEYIYEFELPSDGGGIKKVYIRDDSNGHFYGENNTQNRGSNFNDEKGNHYDY